MGEPRSTRRPRSPKSCSSLTAARISSSTTSLNTSNSRSRRSAGSSRRACDAMPLRDEDKPVGPGLAEQGGADGPREVVLELLDRHLGQRARFDDVTAE